MTVLGGLTRLVIPDSAYELKAAPARAADSTGFVAIIKEWTSKWLKVLTQRYLFVGEISTIRAAIFRDGSAY